jgi:aryl-alcohol dehydrogenase-like predicted oxidoreductase
MTQATPEGTARFFARHAGLVSPNPLGSTGLQVSPVGFGGYRVSDTEPDHREALAKALLSGVNLIDTSANYADGGSERLVGDALRDLISAGKIARDEIVIVSKAGYVQGANLAEARRRLAARAPYPEMVEYRADCWHCVAPDFLGDQLGRTLERTRLEKIDVFLLHNPEYFLRSGGSREEFERRMLKAFVRLEEEAERGRLQWYGVSSNGFPEAENKSDWVSLERSLELADQAAHSLGKKQSRFEVAQFPLNAYEAGVAVCASNSGKTPLEVARARKIGALANRPLNAHHRGRLSRLSSFRSYDEVEIKGEMHRVLGRAIELEKKHHGDRAAQGLAWAHALRDKLGELDDVLQWRDALIQQIYPSLSKALERAREHDRPWAEEYQPMIVDLLSLIGRDLESVAAKRSAVAAAQFAALAPALQSSSTLSQMAIRVARSFPGVSSVLVGMRLPEYVEDALAAKPTIPPAQAIALVNALQRRG